MKGWFLDRFHILKSEEAQRVRVKKIEMKTGGSTDHSTMKMLNAKLCKYSFCTRFCSQRWGMEFGRTQC